VLEQSKLAHQVNQAGVEFLKTEVQTALTFAAIALEPTSSAEKRRRNLVNARKGYDTAIECFNRVSLSKSEEETISEKLEELRSKLSRLGEAV
jgi:hypothetical protein